MSINYFFFIKVTRSTFNLLLVFNFVLLELQYRKNQLDNLPIDYERCLAVNSLKRVFRTSFCCYVKQSDVTAVYIWTLRLHQASSTPPSNLSKRVRVEDCVVPIFTLCHKKVLGSDLHIKAVCAFNYKITLDIGKVMKYGSHKER